MKCEVNGINAKGYRELSNLIKSGDMDKACKFLEDVQLALATASEITLLIMPLENDEGCQK